MILDVPSAHIEVLDAGDQDLIAVEWTRPKWSRALLLVDDDDVARLGEVATEDVSRQVFPTARPQLEDVPEPLRRLVESLGFTLSEEIVELPVVSPEPSAERPPREPDGRGGFQ